MRIVEHGSTKSNIFDCDSSTWTFTSSYKNHYDTTLSALTHIFLPAGYPDSVRPEYLRYQMWDCLQGLTSYLRGCLTTQALLKGAGVGVSEASSVAAALTWVLKDGVGMASSLFVAYLCSTSFEVNTKEWRLLADFLNNIGLFLNMLVSIFPSQFLLLGCLSAICHSLCGLLAGATRARISAHFVIDKGSLADVTAKESTQETAVTLAGLLLGMIFTGLVGENAVHAWSLFVLLTFVHQWANYRLVRTLVFDTLNPQRCCLLTEDLLRQCIIHNSNSNSKVDASVSGIKIDKGDVQSSRTSLSIPLLQHRPMPFSTPGIVAQQESIFTPLILLLRGPRCGVSLEAIFTAVQKLHSDSRWVIRWYALTDTDTDINSQQWKAAVSRYESEMIGALLRKWADESFIIGVAVTGQLVVCYAAGATDFDILQGYFVSLYIQHRWTGSVVPRWSFPTVFSTQSLGDYYDLLLASTIVEEALHWYAHCIFPNLTVSPDSADPSNSQWNLTDGAATMDCGDYRYEIEQPLEDCAVTTGSSSVAKVLLSLPEAESAVDQEVTSNHFRRRTSHTISSDTNDRETSK